MSKDSLRLETRGAFLELRIDGRGRLFQLPFRSSHADPAHDQSAYPTAGDGWIFEPALRVVHADGNTSTDLRVVDIARNGDRLTIKMRDPEYALSVDLHYRTIADLDVIESWVEIVHDEDGPITLENVASSAIDFGKRPCWLTQIHGDWADEGKMSEEELKPGVKILDSKLGVRAHQFRAPWFMLSLDGPAREDDGEVVGGSLGWSGSYRFSFEVLPNGRLSIICGINPYGSAYKLDPGQTFVTPTMVWAWSGAGTGELSRKLHRYVRHQVIRDGDRQRPILLNNWESTHFTFDERKIISLFDGARELGMELFLLDDGWFGGKHPRDDDTQGLGDWMVDSRKLPNGIGALTSAAEDKGLRFGLWFEPEMVNPRSALFEEHPDWLIQQPKRPHELQRHQMVLDLANPEVREFAFSIVDDALTANPGISFVKWDCNRYLTQPGSPYLPADRQANLQIDYVQALYDIMDRVASKHPNVDLMMCSGGGGRVDYGSMRFAHELWPSDMTDPVRRVFIQWGFSHFMPAIAVAGHVTRWGERPLKFAFDVAMSVRLGMDVDVERLTCEQKAFAASAIASYKEIRDIVQLGDLYRLESPYDGPRSAMMHVLGERSVVFAFSLGESQAEPLRLKGLDPTVRYRVREINVPTADEFVVSGADLLATGLALPAYGECESSVFLLTAGA